MCTLEGTLPLFSPTDFREEAYFDSATWIKAIGKKTYSFVKRDPSLPDVLIIGMPLAV